MTKDKATQTAKDLLLKMTYEDLAKKLGITRPTLYARLAENKWKKGEIALLEKLIN
jgi:DNA invertase Pin-like site-specific DNA recombinase